MQLPEYNCLSEKGALFSENKVISNPKDFISWYKGMKEEEKNHKLHMCFRGISEAKYKNYTTMQRLWLLRDMKDLNLDYKQEVIKIINRNKRDSNFARYMNALGVTINDWLILAFLQHYGGATPLIDFTKSIETALYFACDGIKYNTGTAEIDKYFSIYYFKSVDANKVISSVTQKGRRFYESDRVIGKELVKQLSFQRCMENERLLIVPSYKGKQTVIRERDSNKFLCKLPISNVYSICQDGEFICNADSEEPLENIFVNPRGNIQFLSCANIHKGLRDFIISHYLEGALDVCKTKYFLQEEDIAKEQKDLFLKLT